jgi:hypothetical protein
METQKSSIWKETNLYPKLYKFKLILILFSSMSSKSQKVTTSFVMSICLSFRMEQLGSHWTDFDETWYLSFSENLLKNFKFH